MLIIGYLTIAERKNYIPHRDIKSVLKLGNSFYPDVWDAYFKNFNTIQSNELTSHKVIDQDIGECMKFLLLYEYPPWKNPYISTFKKVVKKYCIFKEDFKTDIVSRFKDSCKILGVHARGTDLFSSRELDSNHAQNREAFHCSDIDKIKKIFEKNGYDKIYLATDDIRFLDSFKSTFGDKCCSGKPKSSSLNMYKYIETILLMGCLMIVTVIIFLF